MHHNYLAYHRSLFLFKYHQNITEAFENVDISLEVMNRSDGQVEILYACQCCHMTNEDDH